jgi:hypothetical protein
VAAVLVSKKLDRPPRVMVSVRRARSVGHTATTDRAWPCSCASSSATWRAVHVRAIAAFLRKNTRSNDVAAVHLIGSIVAS